MNLLALLADKQIIDAALKERVEARAVESGTSYEEALVAEGVSADTIRATIGEYFDLPTRSVSEQERIDGSVLKFFPLESAKHYGIVPLAIEDEVLIVGITDPENLSFRDALNFMTTKEQMPYKLSVILERDFQAAL